MSARPTSLSSLMGPLDLRRLVLLAAFFGLLLVFRHLLVLLVFFVAFERALTAGAHWICARSRLRRPQAAVLIVVVVLLLVGGASYLGIDRLLAQYGSVADVRERLQSLRQVPIVVKATQYVDLDSLLHTAKEHSASAVGWAVGFGHFLIFALVGLILAIVYLAEEAQLIAVRDGLSPHSLLGTLLRWLGYAADAIAVTLQFQIIVAAVNAVLTLPILLIVGIPRAGVFAFVVFVSGMVPVVGNFVSGFVLTLLAYQARGAGGAVAFIVLTFVLHKIESYYLNPRLAARHVELPGFVLIVSLLLWEQLIGFVGLLISFPFLYLCMRIADEFRREDTPLEATNVLVDAKPVVG